MATVPRHVRSIEADIAHRTEVELAREDLAARVRISGRDVVLSGQLSSDVRRRAVQLVSELWGVDRVVDEIEVSETAAVAAASDGDSVPSMPRVRIALSADGGLLLDGQAPSDAAKERWLAAALAAFPDGSISDRLEIDAAAPAEQADALSAAVTTGLAQLSRLEEGSLDVTPARLRISGRADDVSTEVLIAEQFAAELPRAIRVSIDVHADRAGRTAETARAVHLTLARSRDGSVVVSGVVPDLTAKRDWLAKAAAAHPATPVKDRLRVEAFEAPTAYGACALAALPWVSRLIDGRFDIGLKQTRVFGKAKSRDEAGRMQAELAAAGCVLDVAHLEMPRGSS